MAILGDPLFQRPDHAGLDDILRHNLKLLQHKVDAIPEKVFAALSDDDLAAKIAAEESIQPLDADFTAAVANVEPAEVEVNDQFGFRRGPMRVPGFLATKSIPFTGDPNLWHLRPNPYAMSPPYGQVRGQQLVIGITIPATQAEEGARHIAESIARIPEYLQRQAAQIAAYNASLSVTAMQWISARRQRSGVAAQLLKRLGG